MTANRTNVLALLVQLASEHRVCPSCGCNTRILGAAFRSQAAHYADCKLTDMIKALDADKNALPTDWSKVPWTKFEHCIVNPDIYPHPSLAPNAIMMNSRYQVAIWIHAAPEWAKTDHDDAMAHLSIKVNDKTAHHDWRDLQRIKNELCGEECEAVEIFPAESRLVDNANQYHLWVFRPDFKLPFGFDSGRLVSDGVNGTHVQRPFEPDARPADLLDDVAYKKREQELLDAGQLQREGT